MPSQRKKMEKFVSGLMARMTLEEKIGQLNLVTPGGASVTGAVVNEGVEEKIHNGLVGGMFGVGSLADVIKIQDLAVHGSRLGIPILFGSDVIHGYRTTFPVPLGLSCSWNMELIEKTARIAAVEASAAGLRWTFSPMVDIARDPRWGRVAEGGGEDPFLGSRIAESMVRGYQGDDLSQPDTLLACVKHFALYGAAEGGREYNTVDMSPIRMHESYLPPYKAAIDAGCGTLMAAFNDVNGVPATADRSMLTDLLRGKWGFDGFVVTDYTAINEMTAHGVGDLQTVSARALKAGTDMDMVGEGFLTTLQKSLAEGKIRKSDIDAACRRVLEAKYKLGLFDDPFRGLSEEHAAGVQVCPEHRAAAYEAATESCVLLKNGNETLPLKKSEKIALIGPLADDQVNLLGTWSIAGDRRDVVTVLDGIKRRQEGDGAVLYARGSNITDDPVLRDRLNVFSPKDKPEEWQVTADPRSPDEMIAEAVAAAKDSDVVVMVVGEAKEHAGECSSRTELDIPESQRKLMEAVKATGKKLVLVVMSGRPLTLNWEETNADAILFAWHGGVEAGNAIAGLLFGERNPSGKLTMSFPRNVGQIPVYYEQKHTGRPLAEGKEYEKFKSCYIDAPNTPLFPFGYGLSYTTFDYSPVRLNKTALRGRETLEASVTITNTGKYAGAEVAQLYITDPVASIARPVKSLKGFQKIFLEPGEAREVTFEITPELLKFYNEKLRLDWESGEFIIQIGTSSEQVQSATVNWQKEAPKRQLQTQPDVH
ncbi:MAG TPA: beta-glucosidase BglX [Patescibacteria group bacterium]|nr:beta-glucosidase BglX [Patescibacteria group bacterium]